MSYTVDYIRKPATEGQVQELIDKLNSDLDELDRIEAYYGEVPQRDDRYQRLADRARNRFSLAESYQAEIEGQEPEIDDNDAWGVKAPVRLNGVDMAIKSRDPEFSEWAREQVRLMEMWRRGE
jgi:hypothetical protein